VRNRARAAAARVAGLRQGFLGVAIRRVVLSVPLLFIVSGLVFLLMSIVPGDVTELILGSRTTSGLEEWQYEQLRTELHLDRPLHEQYWFWLRDALQGDLGESLRNHQPISEAIAQRFPVTLALTVGSLFVSLFFGVGLGMVSAVRGGALGRAVDALAMIGWVMPVFWIAAELIVVFAVKLHWFPASGYVPFAQSPGEWFRSLVLPVIALSIGAVGGFAKFTREAMLDALATEYVRMARANGIRRMSIILRHAFKPASLQVVTLAGLLTVGLLIGTVFAERVFALPGMGSLIVEGTDGHDLTMVQGVAVFFTVIVVAVNLTVDLAYSLLSPRVRVS
jgi:peptide/nickel transport system permease protein